MHTLTLSLGANCGNRHDSITLALEWLKSQLMSFEQSDIYETPAVNRSDAPKSPLAERKYLNAVARGKTDLSPEDFEAKIKAFEIEHGRDAQSRLDNRVPIDIDIVICDDEILRPWDYQQLFFRNGFISLT